jgi:hypothetical protein
MRARWVALCLVILACGRIKPEPDDGGDVSIGGFGAADDDPFRTNDGGRESTSPTVGGGAAMPGSSGGSVDGAGGADESAGGGSGVERCSLGRPDRQYYIRNNEDAENLRNVRALAGTLYITGDVDDLSPLKCLREVGGDLGIYSTTALVDLGGLENLTTIGRTLYVGHYCDKQCQGNLALRSVALAGLRHVNEIVVEPRCETESGSSPCALNWDLESVEFDALVEAPELIFVQNPSLRTVSMNDLTTSATILMRSNPSLELAEFNSLTTLGRLALSGDEVTSLPKLPKLEQAATLELSQTNLAGLAELNRVPFTTVQLNTNPKLVTLEGLEGVLNATYIGLSDNNNLGSLRALSNLKSVDTLYILNNTKLPTCEADWLVDHVGLENISNTVNIVGTDDAGACEE